MVLAADRTDQQGRVDGRTIPFLVKSASQIYRGALAAADVNGHLVPIDDSTADLKFVGAAIRSVLGDGVLKCPVERRGTRVQKATGADQSWVGKIAYAIDDEEVTITPPSGTAGVDHVVGRVIEFHSATKVEIDLEDSGGAEAAEAAGVFAATGITGAELETLSDGSVADALHTHDSPGIEAGAIDDAHLAGDVTRAKMIKEALAVFGMPFQALRNADGTVLDATGGAALFKINPGGFGSGTLTIDGNAATGAAITSTLQYEFILPPEYVAGGDINLVVTAKESVGAATVATTISAEAYLSDGEGAAGSDLYNAFDETDVTEAWQTHTAVITPTGLVAGDRLIVFVRTVADDTGGAVGTVVQIGKVEMRVDIKG